MNETPKSLRLQIGIFGRTNVGKSSLLNLIAGQDVAITSPVPGTTTDVVEKPMELLPVGPVVFLDTAGLDDTSVLAAERVRRTAAIFDRADVAVLVVEPEEWSEHEDRVIAEAAARECPVILAINKCDLGGPTEDFLAECHGRAPHVVAGSCLDRSSRDAWLDAFKACLAAALPPGALQPPSLAGDLLPPGGLAVLVVPIDLQAPKGRLILPQVQVIRDALDNDAAAMVVKEREYGGLLQRLVRPPDLVVCDSQAVLKTVADTR